MRKKRLNQSFLWPLTQWFGPRWVVEWKGSEGVLHVFPGDEEGGLELVQKLRAQTPPRDLAPITAWSSATSRERYLAEAGRLLQHIHRGDIYEVNYCTRRTTVAPSFDPFVAFDRLQHGTEAPFSALYRLGDGYALCASPERFLHFDGVKVKAEPMKGTRPRSDDAQEDGLLGLELVNDEKERSENIMAVDVMRNDLSRTAAPGSVRVTELCGVRSYPRVHQMVSTIVSERATKYTPWDVVRAAFPMASMTGAPKLRAMQLIDVAEDQARGLYSGTMGFFAPDGTGDLNVVIRTLLFDARNGSLALSTGSALTALCDPELEWEECELKARSVLNALGHAG